MPHRLGQRIHVLERGVRASPHGLAWPDVRPLMLAIGADPVGAKLLTEHAERQLTGLSCIAVMKRLAKVCKGIRDTDTHHG